MRIFLTGVGCIGKTTVGQKLADLLGCPFFDLDAEVESYFGTSIERLQRDYPETPYVFVSERKAPLTPDAVRKIVTRAGQHAGLEFPIHPHMLRHATGYKLANDGQDT